ncbi:MAG: hypothetical protein WCI17_10840 [bacterium]
MHFNCPGCQQRLEAESSRVGELVPCPACGRTIQVSMPPLVIHKERSSGTRLVHRTPPPRLVRKGSLEERMAARKAATQEPPGPQYL